MDFIRTIEASATQDELDGWLFGSTRAKIYFDRLPQQTEVGDLVFFSYHGHIIAVSTLDNIQAKPEKGRLWLWLRDIKSLQHLAGLKFRAYASIRYVPRLATQYAGRYRTLAAKLAKIGAEYRAGLLQKA